MNLIFVISWYNQRSWVSSILSIEIGPHHITGNGVGFKPDILDMDVMEKVLEVSTADLKNREEVKRNKKITAFSMSDSNMEN